MGLDGAGVRVVVVGTGTHAHGSRLPDVPAVAATVDALGATFTEACGVDPAHLTTVLNPEGPEQFLDAVLAAASVASEVLLIYYVGHGLLNVSGELHLATNATVDVSRKAGFQALAYSEIVTALVSCRARQVVVVLDCCFSARATVPVRSGALLASADRDEQALAPRGEELTAFSGAMVRALRNGISTAAAHLTLAVVHDHLTRVSVGQGRPAPVLQTGNAARGLVLAPNAADRSVEPEPLDEAPVDDVGCPYRGLEHYTAADRRLFHGRKQLVARVLDRIGQQVHWGGPTIVAGPSGSGKSSLMHAGVGPAIRHGELGILGAAAWPLLTMVPGTDPLGSLAAALAALDPREVDVSAARAALADDARRLVAAVASRAAPPDTPRCRLVVVVDQFEEIFDPDVDAVDRAAFVALLDGLARPGADGAAPAVVVLGLRSDFTGRCARFPELVAALEIGQVVVGPMTTAELRSAVTEPARQTGLTIEPGLVELLLRDAGADPDDDEYTEYDPGGLPLLSHALLKTWQRRRGTTLTVAAYREIGGVAGAIAATAEATYDALPKDGRTAARRLLPRLVREGTDAPITRRRVPPADLLNVLPEPAAAALDAFTAARLVTADTDTVQITHEALIRSWPRLREWIDADRESRLLAQKVEADAAAWTADGQDADQLYRGNSLARLGAHPLDLSNTAVAFVDASAAVAHRAARRIRQSIAVLAVLLLLAVGGGITAFVQRTLAIDQRDAAIAQRLIVRSGQLAASDQSLAAQLALAAYRVDPSPATRAAVLGTLRTPLSRVLPDGRAPEELRTRTQLVTGAMGGLAAGVDFDGVRLWDPRNPTAPPIGRIATGGGWGPVALSPDERILAIRDSRGVQLWDVTDPARPSRSGTAEPGFGTVSAIEFSGDGTTMVTAVSSDDPEGYGFEWFLMVWRIDDPELPVAAGPPVPAGGSLQPQIAIAPDGTTLASLSVLTSPAPDETTLPFLSRSVAQLWDLRDPAHPLSAGVASEPEGAVTALAFDPDGALLVGGSAGSVGVWDVVDRDDPWRPSELVRAGSAVTSLMVSGDGEHVAATVQAGPALLWDAAAPASTPPHPLPGHADGDTAVAFAGADTLVSSGPEGSVRVWSLPPRGVLRVAGEPRALAASHSEGLAVTATSDGAVAIIDTTVPVRPRALGSLAIDRDSSFPFTAISADGQRAAVVESPDSTSVRVVDLGDPSRPTVLPWPRSSPMAEDPPALALSPDGALLTDGGRMPGGTVWLADVKVPAGPSSMTSPTSEPAQMLAAAFSPDGRLLATADAVEMLGDDGSVQQRIQLWDVTDPARPRLLSSPTSQPPDLSSHNYLPSGRKSVAFAPDGRTLAGVQPRGDVTLWDVSDPAAPVQRGRVADVASRYTHVAVAPSGQLLAAATFEDGHLDLWEISDPTQPVPGARLDVGTAPAAFAAGDTLVLGGDNVVRTLPAAFEPLVNRICAAVGAEMSEQQWNDHVGPGLPRSPLCPV